MNVDLVRRVDRAVGIPLCFALSCASRVRRALRPEPPPVDELPPPPRRILLLKLVEMGSVVLVHPLLRRIETRWPGCEVYFLTFEESREVVGLLGSIPAERVLTLSMRGPWRFVASIWSALRRARALGLDATIDLELFSRLTAILSFLSGARSRVGFHRFHAEGLYRGDLLTHRVAYNPYLHTAQAFLSLSEALGRDPREVPMVKLDVAKLPLPLPRFQPTAEQAVAVRGKLEQAAGAPIAGKPLYVLNPNASELIPIRRWPLDRYVDLARRLLAEPASLVFMIGGHADGRSARQIAKEVGSARLVDLTGQTDLRELLTLFSMATAMVTNDSGPAHFASLTQLATVTLFGPENPQLYGPLGSRQRSLYAGYACSPCVSTFNHRHTPCDRARCLEELSVDLVMATLTELRAWRAPSGERQPALRVAS